MNSRPRLSRENRFVSSSADFDCSTLKAEKLLKNLFFAWCFNSAIAAADGGHGLMKIGLYFSSNLIANRNRNLITFAVCQLLYQDWKLPTILLIYFMALSHFSEKSDYACNFSTHFTLGKEASQLSLWLKPFLIKKKLQLITLIYRS